MQTGQVGQTSGGFTGVNLRVARTAMTEGGVARSINADLHQQLGVAQLRAGRQLLSASLAGKSIRRITKINGSRFILADGNVYRDFTLVKSTLSTDDGTLVPFRPLNNSNIYCFAAGNTDMVKIAGSTVTDWGSAAPTATPVVAAGAAGSLTGDYTIRYTYIRKVGSVVEYETNPSPVSNTVTLAAQQLNLSGLTASSDTQITHKRIYRTTASGATYLQDQDIANATTTGTSTQADTALSDLVETDNDQPPVAYYGFIHMETMFLLGDAANPHYLWFSKRFRPEQVPPANFIEIGNADDPLLCGGSIGGVCGVFTARTKYLINGNATTSYAGSESLSRRGIKAPNSLAFHDTGAIFMANDGVYITDFSSNDQSIAEEIEPLFYGKTVNGYDGFNWNAKHLFAGVVWKNRYYLSVATGSNLTPNLLLVFSFDTKKWYWYDMPVTAMEYERDTEILCAGLVSGNTCALEMTATDEGSAITFEVETGDIVGEEGIHALKLFLDATIDADTAGAAITVKIYVGDTLKTTQTVTTTERKTVRLKLPSGCLGTRGRFNITYSGSAAIKIYGASLFYNALGAV